MRDEKSPLKAWKLALAATVLCGLAFAAYLAPRPWLGQADALPAEGAEAEPPRPLMDEAQRAFLWDIEHHGLVLSRHGFRRLADALRREDAAALAAILATSFRGQVMSQPRVVRVENDGLAVVREQDAGHPPAALSRDEFVARLLACRRLFGPPPRVQLALMTLSPLARDDLDGPWDGTCQLRLWGETTPGRPAEVVLSLQYQVSRPAEPTLAAGGWLHACTIRQTLTARAPRFLLREVAAERGLDPGRFHDNWKQGRRETITGGVSLCDYDRDGFLDMLVVDLNACALYKGQPGGKFADVTVRAGLPSRPRDANAPAAFADLDGDGWEDLLLDLRVFRNEEGKGFRDVSHLSNLRLTGSVSGVAVADYDRDGRLDLYVARVTPPKASSWLDGKGDGRGSNLLYRNLGNWQFEEVAARSGATGGDRSTFSAVWLDADNDGWPDLHVINEFGPGVLLVNQKDGTFRERPLADGPGDFGSMGVTAGDFDNDGNIDLYVGNMYSKAGSRVIGNVAPGTYPEAVMAKMRQFVAGSQLHRNTGRSRFEPLGQKCQVAAVGWAYGPAFVDLDNDGWLDLYATAGFVSQNRDEPDG